MIRGLAFSLLASFLAVAANAEWPRRPAAVQALVQEAFAGNLALKTEDANVDQALAQLELARSQYQPRLDIVARYTRADGGRTIDFPIGDLLNPVYATLNEMLAAQGRAGSFPSVSNQSIPLLREREQETKLRLVQPIYQPAITRGVRARRAGLQAREAQRDVYRRELRFQVESAWYRYLQADSAVRILESSRGLTAEALRTNKLLYDTEKITEDRVLRAEADDLAVRQQLAEAQRDRNTARALLNVLLNRPLSTPPPAADETEIGKAVDSAVKDAPSRPSPDNREELVALQKNVDAAAALEAVERSRQGPTLSLAVEGGIQGEDYRTGSGYNYVQGSVVAEANLWDGKERRNAIRSARLELKKAQLQLADARQQLSLEVQRAADDLTAAVAGLETATRRRAASAKAFEIVRLREREGMDTQLTFLDARNELTGAELNLAITQHRLLVAAAALDRAAALSPLP